MKKIVAAALAAMMLMTAGTAMAAGVEVNGDISVHYRHNTRDNSADQDGGKFTLHLNAKTEVAKNLDVYARLAVQKLFADETAGQADFDRSQYHSDSAVTLDRFGVVLQGKGFNYTLGRQDLFLGQGLLYDTTGYMGVNLGAIDGFSVAGKTGVTNLKVIAGKTWGADDTKDHKIYAVDASYSPVKDWTVGATFAKVDFADTTPGKNVWAVNAAYTTGKATISGEYGKANTDTKNKGYAFGTSYAFDSKNSGFIIYSYTEHNVGLISDLTTYDDGGKGFYYGFSHKLTKDTTVNFFYKNMKEIGTDTGYTSLRGTVTYKF